MAKRSEYGAYRNPMDTGYIRVWCPGHPTANKDGYALEHRKVLYDAGLLPDLKMVVHHINGNKADNRLENLEAKTASVHLREHALEAGTITNQYGTFPVVATREGRLARSREFQRVRRDRGRETGDPCGWCGAPCAPKARHCSRSCGSKAAADRRLNPQAVEHSGDETLAGLTPIS